MKPTKAESQKKTINLDKSPTLKTIDYILQITIILLLVFILYLYFTTPEPRIIETCMNQIINITY